jgi:hypothetical protein
MSHALLPSFVVAHHLDTAETMGAALAGRTGEVPAPTVAGWRRRLRDNNAALTAGAAAAVVSLGAEAPRVQELEDPSSLVQVLWWAVASRVGMRAPRPWSLLNLVTGSSWLATRVKSSWVGVGVVPIAVRGP